MADSEAEREGGGDCEGGEGEKRKETVARGSRVEEVLSAWLKKTERIIRPTSGQTRCEAMLAG